MVNSVDVMRIPCYPEIYVIFRPYTLYVYVFCGFLFHILIDKLSMSLYGNRLKKEELYGLGHEKPLIRNHKA